MIVKLSLFNKIITTCLQIALIPLSFFLIIFFGCGVKCSDPMKIIAKQTNIETERLSPTQMKEDLDYLIQVIISSHPDMNFFKSEKDFAKKKTNCYKKLDRDLSLEEFFNIVNPVVNALGDDHTMIYPPKGKCPKQQYHYAKEIYQDIKGRETISNNTYIIINEKKICILRFNTCGSPNEYHLYKDFFKKIFTEINEQKIDTLIVDIRNNQGGYSGNSSELLRYITDTPFRQYENATRKISQESLAFYENCDINLLVLLKKDFDTSSLKVSDSGELMPGTFITEAKYLYPVDENLRFKGKTYILIGPNVFSSGMLFANTAQYYKIAPLVGKKTRWKFSKQHVGDVIIGTLPHSNLYFMVSTTVFIVSKLSGKSSTHIVPDYNVSRLKFSASKNRDAILEYAIKLAGKTL